MDVIDASTALVKEGHGQMRWKEVKEFATRPDDPCPSPRAHIIRENRLPPCEFQGTLVLSSSQGCHDMCAPHHTQMNFNHFSRSSRRS